MRNLIMTVGAFFVLGIVLLLVRHADRKEQSALEPVQTAGYTRAHTAEDNPHYKKPPPLMRVCEHEPLEVGGEDVMVSSSVDYPDIHILLCKKCNLVYWKTGGE